MHGVLWSLESDQTHQEPPTHAATTLHRCLEPLLQPMHRRRLATLLAAVVSCVSGPRLSLTDLGRRFAGTTTLRHAIERSDWLLGNRHLCLLMPKEEIEYIEPGPFELRADGRAPRGICPRIARSDRPERKGFP